MSAESVTVLHLASGTYLQVSQKSITEGEYPKDEYEVQKPTTKTKPPKEA